MGDYAETSHVLAASFDPIDESRHGWVDHQVQRAENLLKTKVPRLQQPGNVGALMAENARTAVVNAVLRLLANPRGYKSEAVEDQSFVRFDDKRAGTLYFDDEELSWFRPVKRRRVGNVGIAPSKWSQV